MKKLSFIFFLSVGFLQAQKIAGIQLFNPQTNDETAIIGFNEQLILRFDDLTNSSQVYRYTLKHYDRNWQDDGLFFTEFANGSLNALIDNFQYSFNTTQAYTHYQLTFPNEKITPKISGNYEIIVYKDSADKPLFKKRFSMYENAANLGLQITRFQDAKNPDLRQRVEIQAVGSGTAVTNNINSISLTVMQNNNWNTTISNQRPTSTLGNKMLFQQLNIAFPGNSEFYYFDNKVINQAYDMVANVGFDNGQNQTFLYPVWAYPETYQAYGDVDGAFYFRRNDLGIERDANKEADYSWVHFALESLKMNKDIYVLGLFNDYKADKNSLMTYDEANKMYVAKIYLKQGFYNYMLATKNADGSLNFGEINGNFWQTENLYQGLLYYTPFGRNYDGLLGYGEFRTPVK
ncbi:type IX secretion system plug protein domain-containing protein [Soonwooa sp.]|uniref:type IX secretion system plug protein n=1 Tax=Soonwooa sp. TaxID=1938592 RepID=UPI0026160AB3|nr:type IX secretion system plug protein domain-containing protein [Soonwooa sp.]